MLTHLPDRRVSWPLLQAVSRIPKRLWAALSTRLLGAHPRQIQSHDLEPQLTQLREENSRLKAQIEEHIQNERLLKEERNLLRSLIDIVPDFIYVKDRDSHFILLNRATLKRSGRSDFQEVIGKTDFDIFPAEIAEQYHEDEQKVIETGNMLVGKEEPNQPHDGEPGWLLTTKVPLSDDEGNIVGLVGIGRDITERKRAEIALQTAHAELEQRVIERTAALSQAHKAEHEQRLLAEALYRTAAAINGTLRLDEILDQIFTHLERIFPFHDANIALIENGLSNVVRHWRPTAPIPNEPYPTMPLSVKDTPTLCQMVETRRPLLISNSAEFPGWVTHVPNEPAVAYVGAPICIEGEVIGFLNLNHPTPGTFVEKHRDQLEGFANQAAIAIHNARLYNAIRNHANELEQRVTERTAELEQERAQVLIILDAMVEGVVGVIFDEEGKPTRRYVNRAFADMLGFTAEEWEVTRLRRAVASEAEVARTVESYSQAMESSGFWRAQLKLCRKDGSEFESSITANRVNDPHGKQIGVVTVIRDISQEKVLDEQRSRFVANASHELRTPITNLLTRLYLLRKQPERIAEHVEVLESVSLRMRNLVEDLLEFSRFERGVIPLKPRVLDLRLLVTDVIRIQDAEAAQKRIKLVCQTPLMPLQILADPDRMTQVLTNLITNAINYTPEGGTIDIDFVVEPREEPEIPVVAVRVRDSGIGIAPELVPHIFEPFYRGSESTKGTGLGLSITREIVRMHGGTISVENVPSGGSTFIIRLTLVQASG